MNGARGTRDIEGSEPDWQIVTRVGASECGNKRVSISLENHAALRQTKRGNKIDGLAGA